LGTLIFAAALASGSGWPLVPLAAKDPAKPAAAAKATATTSPASPTAKTESKTPASAPVPSSQKAEPKPAKKLEGHSFHGEVFNEGPRQKAYLMGGTGKVHFPCTTKNPEVQKFIDQGVGQLHGFWYFEAERSFRQAAALDPDCAIAYWGMAMANIENWNRAKGFIAEALKPKKGLSERETKYLDGLDSAQKATTEKARAERLTKSFEEIAIAYPHDLEAKAFLAVQMWRNRNDGVPIQSLVAVDALLKQILAVEPMHPCHHYVIHLWDYEKSEFALASAARGGQSAPAIAHMWHMPGHTYSRLHRYHDAIYQQEASARVDHAHMMRDRVLPDQIHNFAHNNEWLIRNLMFVGQCRKAMDLAKNMTELPRHPKYNTLAKRSSASYGRQRLFEVLERFELWDDVLELAETPYLEPTADPKEQTKRSRLLARAYYAKQQFAQGDALLAELEKQLAAERQKSDSAAAEAEKKFPKPAAAAAPAPKSAPTKPTPMPAPKPTSATPPKTATSTTPKTSPQKSPVTVPQPATNKSATVPAAPDKGSPVAAAKGVLERVREFRGGRNRANRRGEGTKTESQTRQAAIDAARKPFAARITELEKSVRELQGWKAWGRGDAKEALTKLKGITGVDPLDLALIHLAAGDTDEALRVGRNAIKRKKNEVLPLARLCDLLVRCKKMDEAKQRFAELRTVAGLADLDIPALQRLAPLAAEMKLPADWRIPHVAAKDVGDRPSLDKLGPFRWSPYVAPRVLVKTAAGEVSPLLTGSPKPTLVIFYLGTGCLHCMQQLQAFAPKVAAFEKAGISIVAVSSDAPDSLQQAYRNFGKGEVAFPHFSNSTLDNLTAFRAFRAYDDFEKQPLHGTFLIDADGRVRWQDISYQPFMDADFLLLESQRLLKLSGGASVTTPVQSSPSVSNATIGAGTLAAEMPIEAPRP